MRDGARELLWDLIGVSFLPAWLAVVLMAYVFILRRRKNK